MLLTFASPAWAGTYTYRDVFPGARASGMGGAYTALANDASGAYYNPAGLVDARDAHISLSATAFSLASREFEGGLFGETFENESFTFIPTNFGVVWGFDTGLGPISAALSVVVPEQTELRSKDRFTAVPVATDVFDLTLDFKEKFSLLEVGPALAWAPTDTLSIGLTVYYVTGQEAETSFIAIDDAGATDFQSINYTTSEDDVSGFTAVLGLLWRPSDELRLGLSVRPPTDYHHFRKERTSEFFGGGEVGGFVPFPGTPSATSVGFTEGVPATVSVGGAWSPSEGVTLAADFLWSFAERYPAGGTPVEREGTWNLSGGAEIRLAESIPVWIGGYTNRSAAPEIRPGRGPQATRLDTYGFTLGAAWVTEHTELSLGLRQGFATGETTRVQIEPDPPAIDVTGSETQVVIGSRYKF